MDVKMRFKYICGWVTNWPMIWANKMFHHILILSGYVEWREVVGLCLLHTSRNIIQTPANFQFRAVRVKNFVCWLLCQVEVSPTDHQQALPPQHSALHRPAAPHRGAQGGTLHHKRAPEERLPGQKPRPQQNASQRSQDSWRPLRPQTSAQRQRQ